MENHFERRYKSLMNKIGNVSHNIKRYLNIEDDKITINFQKCNDSADSLIIIINYFNKNEYINFNLPKEVNDIIDSFCGNYIKLKFKLECINNFPFLSPTWKLLDLKNNLKSNNIINLHDYYIWIIDNINYDNSYRFGWTVIYGFEKEILILFTRINHFASIENNY